MLNLEKIREQASPPFKKACPCIILPSPFLIFQESSPTRNVIKIYFATFLNKGAGSMSCLGA